jgi:hypothetical protein
VTEEEAKDKVGEAKTAIHEYEEKKGDWSKTGGQGHIPAVSSSEY